MGSGSAGLGGLQSDVGWSGQAALRSCPWSGRDGSEGVSVEDSVSGESQERGCGQERACEREQQGEEWLGVV